MIVKNESKVIRRCLESVLPLVDYWVIVDTGSTDGTQQIILECLKEVPGFLHERPWVDFSHNRNEAIALLSFLTIIFKQIDLNTIKPELLQLQ